MKRTLSRSLNLSAGIILSAVSLAGLPASALSSNASTSTKGDTTTVGLSVIIQKGDKEITRRLTSLNAVAGKISSASKLSSADKATLSDEVSTEISGLTTLKANLDDATDTATAKTDAESIFNDYRVYALILPKINLVKTADDQQVTETKLTSLATKLKTSLAAKPNAGLQTKLDDMNSQIAASQGISSSIESAVVSLQPSDYNSDHTILSGDRDKLKTAQADNKVAIADGKAIVAGLK